MIDAWEEHADIRHDANVLHVVELVDFDDRLRTRPHEQQMQNVQYHTAQQADFDAGAQARDQAGQPGDEIAPVLRPQLDGQLKIYLQVGELNGPTGLTSFH